VTWPSPDLVKLPNNFAARPSLIHAGGRGRRLRRDLVQRGHDRNERARGPRFDVRVQLWDGREFDATVTVRDPRRDLACFESCELIARVYPADSSQLRPGWLAIAIANPMGFGWRAYHGRDSRHRPVARAWSPNLGAGQCAARSAIPAPLGDARAM